MSPHSPQTEPVQSPQQQAKKVRLSRRRSRAFNATLRAVLIAEAALREMAGRLHLPPQDRIDMMQLADMLARVLTKSGLR